MRGQKLYTKEELDKVISLLSIIYEASEAFVANNLDYFIKIYERRKVAIQKMEDNDPMN